MTLHPGPQMSILMNVFQDSRRSSLLKTRLYVENLSKTSKTHGVAANLMWWWQESAIEYQAGLAANMRQPGLASAVKTTVCRQAWKRIQVTD